MRRMWTWSFKMLNCGESISTSRSSHRIPFLLHSLLDTSLPHSLLILDDAKVVLPVSVSLAPLTAGVASVP